ncbi:MAG: exodeoxyribonuclease III [Muribaculaceae bacterium]|nr:exodeoxyribonuclease III [Muribaculaceae bacterium]
MSTKIVSWNVNGLRSQLTKGFDKVIENFDADMFCVQETKLQEGQFGAEIPGYDVYWHHALKKGYSGVAIFTRRKPLNVSYGIGSQPHDDEGRTVTLEFDDFYLVSVYSPNAQEELRRLDFRMDWEEKLLAYLKELDKTKPVVICGDMNVAKEDIDLKNPKTNHKNPGFSDEERDKMRQLQSAGFADTFRHIHGNVEGAYTWWSFRFKAREKNVGWRIDYFLVSDRLLPKLSSAEIHADVMGSDHCPVSIILED